MSGEHCPNGDDLRDSQIDPEYVKKGYYGEPTDVPRYYSRRIGIQIRGVYDGVLFYQCPDCGCRWHRFEEGSRLWSAAQPYVEDVTKYE